MGIYITVSFAKTQRKWTIISLVKEIVVRWANSTIVFRVDTLSRASRYFLFPITLEADEIPLKIVGCEERCEQCI